MSRQFLGWDCANKTLAWSHISIDIHIYSKLSIIIDEFVSIIDDYMGCDFSYAMVNGLNDEQRELLSMNLEDPEFCEIVKFVLDTILYFTDNFIIYFSNGVVDILNGKKVSETDELYRTHALYNWLVNSDVELGKIYTIDDFYKRKTTTIIEHQPSKIGTKTNNKSTAVGHQLAFYYINNDPIFINPKLKNNISFGEGMYFAEYLSAELAKNKSRKDAIYAARKSHSRDNFLYLVSVLDLDEILEHIPRSCLDDLADSTMQILAYLVENKLFN